MLKIQILKVLGAVALLMVLGSSTAQAQYVSMSAEYHEANGRVVNIPHNQPAVICGATINTPPLVADARCVGARQTIYQPPVPGAPFQPLKYIAPANGVPNVNGTIVGGLNVGDQFTIPTEWFKQTPSIAPPLPGPGAVFPVAGPVVDNAVIWISTAFTARLPGAARLVAPPASTRVMRNQGTGAIPGQPARPTGVPGTITVAMVPPVGSSDTGTMSYTEGPNKFGGTMSALLDGTSRLFIKSAGFDAFFPTAYTPVLATQPVGNAALLLNPRNGMGWDYTVTGGQTNGVIYGLSGTGIVPCAAGVAPATPANCNNPGTVPNPAPSKGLPFGTLPAATSVKHVFPWTTGTVTNVVHAVRGAPRTFTTTLTAMGYDTTTATPGVRNVGLVAGSYSARVSGLAGVNKELNTQIIGMNLSFTPEPGATVALFAGIGLLGVMAARRRR